MRTISLLDATCGSCTGSCGGCEPFAMAGSAAAVGEAVVRLQGQGWQFRSEPREAPAGVWRMRVQPARV